MMYSSINSTATLNAMLRQEKKGYKCEDYFHPEQHSDKDMTFVALHNREVNRNNREKMVDWYNEVAECCNFSCETVAIATSCLDRFVATKIGFRALVNSSFFRLAGMTALYITVKIYEVEVMDPGMLSKLSQGLYTEDDIEKMEVRMLSALEWRVNPPTALAFVRQFLDMIHSLASMNSITMNNVYDLSQIQIKLALRNSRLVATQNSTIAFASLVNSLRNVSDLDRQTIEFIGYRISKVTGIDWYSEDFKDAEWITHANIDERSCSKFKVQINTQSHSIGKFTDSTAENSPRSLTRFVGSII